MALPNRQIGGAMIRYNASRKKENRSGAGRSREVFGLNDINERPISYDIAWYEQKAVAVLFALIFLGVKGLLSPDRHYRLSYRRTFSRFLW